MNTTFKIQAHDGTYTDVAHDEFYKFLNGSGDYLYFARGGLHLALQPTAENEATVQANRSMDYEERAQAFDASRCRDVYGRVCRNQHDANGNVVRDAKGHPVRSKCGDCPRDGWQTGNRDNCCLRNYCTTEDCVYCPYPHECNTPLSLEWLSERYSEDDTDDNYGYQLVDGGVDLQTAIEREELHEALHTAFAKLPAKQRQMLHAVYWDRQSLRAYAAANGIGKSTAYRLHQSALDSLKTALSSFC